MKFRLNYFYISMNSFSVDIPVNSIYEAVMVKLNLSFSDLVKYKQGVIPDYCNGFALEVCVDSKKHIWEDWYDENGNDDMEEWLREHEPENYAHYLEVAKSYVKCKH